MRIDFLSMGQRGGNCNSFNVATKEDPSIDGVSSCDSAEAPAQGNGRASGSQTFARKKFAQYISKPVALIIDKSKGRPIDDIDGVLAENYIFILSFNGDRVGTL